MATDGGPEAAPVSDDGGCAASPARSRGALGGGAWLCGLALVGALATRSARRRLTAQQTAGIGRRGVSLRRASA